METEAPESNVLYMPSFDETVNEHDSENLVLQVKESSDSSTVKKDPEVEVENETSTVKKPVSPIKRIGTSSNYRQVLQKQEFKAQILRKLEMVPRVAGVCFDRNRQRWIAHWKVGGKYVKNYFPVSQYGFENGRDVAIRCRRDAEKVLQLDRANYNKASSARNQSKPSRSIFLEKTIKKRTKDISNDDISSNRDRHCWVLSYADSMNGPDEIFNNKSMAQSSSSSKWANQYNTIQENGNHTQGLWKAEKGEEKSNGDRSGCKTMSYNINDNNEDSMFLLTQKTVQIILGDLKLACVPKLHRILIPGSTQAYSDIVDEHMKRVTEAVHLCQLRHYLLLFCECILGRQLPSSMHEKQQLLLLDTILYAFQL